MRSTLALERFSESSKPIRPDSELRMSAPRLDNLRGKILESEGSLPLIVRTPHGLGEIMFIAADLDRAPLVDWSGRKQFVQKLLTGKALSPEPKTDGQTGNPLGISDLTGQLRNALDQFEGVRLVPFSVVAGLVFLYILLIGPGDFFLVKRVLRRMELTWITFPVMVLAVSLGAYLLAYYLKGDQLRINQVNLVDVDVEDGLVRGTTWLNVFSPPHCRLQPHTASPDRLRTPREAAHRRGVLSAKCSVKVGCRASSTSCLHMTWLIPQCRLQPHTASPIPLRTPRGVTGAAGDPTMGADRRSPLVLAPGMPGSVYGGLNRNNAAPQLFSGSYDYSPKLDALEGVPIQVWSTKSFSGRWHYPELRRGVRSRSVDGWHRRRRRKPHQSARFSALQCSAPLRRMGLRNRRLKSRRYAQLPRPANERSLYRPPQGLSHPAKAPSATVSCRPPDGGIRRISMSRPSCVR